VTRGARVEVFRDGAGEWRWRTFAGNGEEVAKSEEGYADKGYAVEVASERNPEGLPLFVITD
jgi:uncharacterized protein YegP (UPF0339 family)